MASVQDLGSRGVNVNATLRKVGNAERAVPLDDPQRILLIQHRKWKRALDLFSHLCKAVKVEGLQQRIKKETGHKAVFLSSENKADKR